MQIQSISVIQIRPSGLSDYILTSPYKKNSNSFKKNGTATSHAIQKSSHPGLVPSHPHYPSDFTILFLTSSIITPPSLAFFTSAVFPRSAISRKVLPISLSVIPIPRSKAPYILLPVPVLPRFFSFPV